MRMLLKGAAIALALAGTSLAATGSASADDYGRYHRHHHHNAITIGFGDVAFGYRDGYWDNGHRWHGWDHDGDYRSYRDHRGSNYHDWNHDRDDDNGWSRH